MSSTSLGSTADTSVQTKPTVTSVISCDEVERYHELGLGRGVNVTDPQMWKNKSSFLVRKVDSELENVIGTEESGVLTSYEKEVSTFSAHQQKLRVAVSDSISSVKIGVDEHFSRSFSSAKLIIGHKIEQRAISFKFHPDDIPIYTDHQKATLDPPTNFLFDQKATFEGSLCDWILKRMADREIKAKSIKDQRTREPSLDQSEPPKPTEPSLGQSEPLTPTEIVFKLHSKLNGLLTSSDEKQHHLKNLSEDCVHFVNNLGLTHYVSSIKLGACHYQETTTKSKQKQLGVGASVGAGSSTKGSFSGMIAQQWRLRTVEQQKIGRINVRKGTVQREAVIGFQVQPLHKLVRIQLIQMLLQKAIKEYITKKEDCIEGPFLILCEMSNQSPQENTRAVAGAASLSTAGYVELHILLPKPQQRTHQNLFTGV